MFPVSPPFLASPSAGKVPGPEGFSGRLPSGTAGALPLDVWFGGDHCHALRVALVEPLA